MGENPTGKGVSGQQVPIGAGYRAPVIYIVVFYVLLLAWTGASLPMVQRKFASITANEVRPLLYGFMVAFVYGFTWFWSLGVFYRLSLDAEGGVAMKSLRRTRRLEAREISRVEGSHLPGSFGFVTIKLPRERCYLFCFQKDAVLEAIVGELKRRNPALIRINI